MTRKRKVAKHRVVPVNVALKAIWPDLPGTEALWEWGKYGRGELPAEEAARIKAKFAELERKHGHTISSYDNSE